MELSKILLDTSALSKWIAKDFTLSALSKFDKIHHALSAEKFNRIIKDKSITYKFLGLEIDSIFVYDKGERGFCSYLFLNLHKPDLDIFVKEFGMPLNVLATDFLIGDFDFLHWINNGFEIFITRNYSVECRRNSCKVTILNIPLIEISDDRPIE